VPVRLNAQAKKPPLVSKTPILDKEQAAMIHVLAIITAKPGKRDSILQAFRANVPVVSAEGGCIEYGAAVDADNAQVPQTKCGPDTFLVIEKWASMDALKAHAAAPHMAAYRAKTSEMIANRVIHILAPT
jgi:quinol monooxygenase YgiN